MISRITKAALLALRMWRWRCLQSVLNNTAISFCQWRLYVIVASWSEAESYRSLGQRDHQGVQHYEEKFLMTAWHHEWHFRKHHSPKLSIHALYELCIKAENVVRIEWSWRTDGPIWLVDAFGVYIRWCHQWLWSKENTPTQVSSLSDMLEEAKLLQKVERR